MDQVSFSVTPEPRPRWSSDSLDREVARALLPEIISWMGGLGGSTEEEVLNDVADVVSGGGDGFEIAKELEHMGWSVNSRLVDIMDGAEHERWRAFDHSVAEWVARNQIKPSLSVGERVVIEKEELGRKEDLAGEIVSIDEKHARYVVFIESLGHVRPPKQGTTGIYVGFENVRKQ